MPNVKPRTDSVLHTGMSSAREAIIHQKNKERIEKKQAIASQMSPLEMAAVAEYLSGK